jgi:hypothetical protein
LTVHGYPDAQIVRRNAPFQPKVHKTNHKNKKNAP